MLLTVGPQSQSTMSCEGSITFFMRFSFVDAIVLLLMFRQVVILSSYLRVSMTITYLYGSNPLDTILIMSANS